MTASIRRTTPSGDRPSPAACSTLFASTISIAPLFHPRDSISFPLPFHHAQLHARHGPLLLIHVNAKTERRGSEGDRGRQRRSLPFSDFLCLPPSLCDLPLLL